MENLEQLFSLLCNKDPKNVELGKVLVEAAGFSEEQLFAEAQLSQFGINNYEELANALDKRLVVEEKPLSDLKPLRLLSSLKELVLVGCQINSIEELLHLQNLQYLDLTNNSLEDIGLLTNLPQLKSLYLDHNPIKDISSLDNLKNLQDLGCFATQVSDYSILKRLPKLERLVVGGGAEVPLDKLPTYLKHLGLIQTPISDLSSLVNHKQLKTLGINGCGLQTLGNLENFSNLSGLSLSDNNLESIAEIAHIRYLRTFSASHNQIKDLKGIKNGRMEIFNISNNPLTSLEGIETLFELKFLNISQTNVTDLSPLHKLNFFNRMRCEGLPDEVIAEYKKQNPHTTIYT